jgi:tetratricopeptide (TPR) repeat protein
MKKSLNMLVLVSWLSMQTLAMACLNMYGTTVHGHSTITNHHPERLRMIAIDLDSWKAQEAELAKDLETADFKHRSDYAVALLHLGRIPEAIEILEQVEQDQPGEYIVAANLGTAYELNGENEKALEWINQGIERNPASHNGSEWLHVKILETKLKMAADPDWLKTHSVLGIDFGSEPGLSDPEIDFLGPDGKRLELEKIASDVEYQLSERLKFIPPQEPIVGDLLFDLANLIALTDVVEHAIPMYEFAEEYGVRDPELLNSRVEHFQKLVAANPQSGEQAGGLSGDRVLLVLGVLAISGLLVLAIVVALIVKFFNHRNRQTEIEM